MAKNHEESWSGDSVLAQRVWDRYASAPGIIPTGSALRLARRIAGAGRLPLLADIQRRWAPPDAGWPSSGSALFFYARPAFYAEPLSPAPGGGARLPKPAGVETQLPRARIAPSAGNVGQVVQRESASSGSAGDRQSKKRQVSSYRAGDPVQTVATTDDLGPAIVQRYRGTPVGRVVQVASPESASLSGPVEPSPGQAVQVQRAGTEPASAADRPLVRPPSRPIGEPGSPVTQGGPGASVIGGDLGPAIVQRHRGIPVGRVMQVASPESPGLSGSVELSSRQAVRVQRAGTEPVGAADRPPVEPPSRLVGESRLPAAQAKSVTTLVATSGDLGAALMQRHLGGPAHHAVQMRLAASGAASEYPPVRLSPSRSGVESKPSVARVGLAVPDAAIGDLGVTIMQRHLGEPVGREGEGRWLATTPGPAGAARWEVAALQRSPVLGVWQDAMSAPSFGWGTLSPEAEPHVGVAPGRVEMPLAKAAGGVQRSGGGVPPVQPRLTDSGARAAVVQRAAADTTATSATGVPAGEPPLPSVAPSGAEGPDLERLADAVYAIIERRLVIERESRGL